MQENQDPKKPWLAVLLNLFPPPLCVGYAYLGLWRRWLKVFGYCVLAWFLTGVTPWYWDSALGFFGIWAAVLWDVHDQTKMVNQEAEMATSAE